MLHMYLLMFTMKIECAFIQCTILKFNNRSYAENLFQVKQIAVKELNVLSQPMLHQN